jgi:hypothetical protein
MGDPASPEGPKNPETDASVGTAAAPVVSIPDRRRIDSDVRAFLREPSTPWIVFDQEGRPPSQLAVGEILRGPRRTLLSDYDFSATAAVDFASVHDHAAQRISEPSSLSVASDLRAAAALPAPAVLDADVTAEGHVAETSGMVGAMFGPRFGVSRRVFGASVVGVALLSLLVVGTIALRGSSPDARALPNVLSAANAAAAQPAAPAAGAPAAAPAIDLAPQPAVAPPPVVATSAVPSVVALTMIPPRTDGAAKSGGGGKYGRLTIAGDARSKDVFMDGKRMLGRGQRTFSVMCGMHTIAVNVRTDAHEVEIPCNAELVVGK